MHLKCWSREFTIFCYYVLSLAWPLYWCWLNLSLFPPKPTKKRWGTASSCMKMKFQESQEKGTYSEFVILDRCTCQTGCKREKYENGQTKVDAALCATKLHPLVLSLCVKAEVWVVVWEVSMESSIFMYVGIDLRKYLILYFWRCTWIKCSVIGE